MPETGTARDAILTRIRQALLGEPLGSESSYTAIPRTFEHAGRLSSEARLHLLIDRLHDYDAEVMQLTAEDEIPAAIAHALHTAAETRAAVPAAFPDVWLPNGFDLSRDGEPPLTTAEVDRAQAVITTCEGAIASTGTLLLVHRGAQGRRILTLLPDHHICLVRRDQVVQTVPEGLARIAAFTRRPITTISGPSATSDIEMVRIRGVHGPRRLTVILHGAA